MTRPTRPSDRLSAREPSAWIRAIGPVIAGGCLVYFARKLGPVSFGRWALALGVGVCGLWVGWTILPHVVWRLIVNRAGSRDLAQPDRRLRLVCIAVVAAILLAIAGLVARAYGSAALAWPLRWSALAIASPGAGVVADRASRSEFAAGGGAGSRRSPRGRTEPTRWRPGPRRSASGSSLPRQSCRRDHWDASVPRSRSRPCSPRAGVSSLAAVTRAGGWRRPSVGRHGGRHPVPGARSLAGTRARPVGGLARPGDAWAVRRSVRRRKRGAARAGAGRLRRGTDLADDERTGEVDAGPWLAGGRDAVDHGRSRGKRGPRHIPRHRRRRREHRPVAGGAVGGTALACPRVGRARVTGRCCTPSSRRSRQRSRWPRF